MVNPVMKMQRPSSGTFPLASYKEVSHSPPLTLPPPRHPHALTPQGYMIHLMATHLNIFKLNSCNFQAFFKVA